MLQGKGTEFRPPYPGEVLKLDQNSGSSSADGGLSDPYYSSLTNVNPRSAKTEDNSTARTHQLESFATSRR